MVTKVEGFNSEAVITILTPHEKTGSKDAERFLILFEYLDPAMLITLDFFGYMS